MMLCLAQWCRFANVSGKHRIIANEMSSIIMRSIISYCRRRCIICVRVQIHTQNYWKHLFHSPLTVESLDAQYACGAFFFAYASVLAPKCHHFCLRQTPGRAWSRYALRVFSVTKCTSRVLAGIFFIPGRHFSGCGRKIKAARGTLWLFHFIFEKEIMEK